MGLRNILLMNCRQASALVQKKKDGQLSFAERWGLWLHVKICRFCDLFFKQSEQLDHSVKLLATKAERDMPYQMDGKVKSQIKEKIQEHLQERR